MDFDLSMEQEILRNSVRQFAEKEIKPVAKELDEKEEFSYDTMRAMGELGLFGMFVSEKYGGQGMARREALEEVGVQIDPQDIEFSSVMHRLNGDERVGFFVRIHDWAGEPVNAEPDKCDELRWVEVNALPANTIPYIRQALQNHEQGTRFYEFGW